MYDIATIKSAFTSYIGFQQSIATGYTIQQYLASPSGQHFVNTVHPLISVENLYAIEDFRHLTPPTYNALTTYIQGQLVTYDSKVYRARTQTTGDQPDTSPDEWRETDVFTAYLESKLEAAVVNVMSEVFIRKKIRFESKELFNRTYLFDGVGRIADRIIKNGRFVGFEIAPKHHYDTMITVNRIGLQLDTPQTLRLYVFHTSQEAALWSEEFTVTTASTFQWFTPSAPIQLKHADTDSGYYYLGYFENDLTGQAIRKDFNFTVRPCSSCNPRNQQYYDLWNRFAEVNPIYVAGGALNGTSLWDIANNHYLTDTNWGMNVELSVGCDVTQFILNHKELYSEAVKTQAALELLRAMAYTQQTSGDSQKLKIAAAYELSPENRMDSVTIRADRALQALVQDVAKLHSPCLAGTGAGIKLRTA